MTDAERHQKIWTPLCRLSHRFIEAYLNYSHEDCVLDGPSLIIANHVTNFDPLLVAITFPKNQMYFVASEHLFRMGWISKLIHYLVAPIPRKKGSSGAETAMACLRKTRSGNTVCLFAEGETTWDGCSQEVFPATGTLAKASGANLVTFRFEGGYLTAPRWGKGIRRGGMRGRVVNVYTPEQLKAMKPDEIAAAINRDIHEDTWERQKAEPKRYKIRNSARFIETALFLCPKCERAGTIVGKGDRVKCSCGLDVQYTQFGTFDPPVPFENMRQWDRWQHERLNEMDFDQIADGFCEKDVSLFEVQEGHGQKLLTKGRLSMDKSDLKCGDLSFKVDEIRDMALIVKRKMVFTHQDRYYELTSKVPCCLRKYLAVWNRRVAGKV